MKNNFKLLATAAAGLESLVARELRNMEVENVTIDDRSRVFLQEIQERLLKQILGFVQQIV